MKNKYDVKFYKGLHKDSKFIREQVFIVEQGFKEEFDDFDNYVDTMVIYMDNMPVATGRLYEIDSATKTFKLGRIAVIKDNRKQGLGKVVIQELEKRAIALGAKRFYVSAQVVAVPFYNKCGYKQYGNTYYEEHIEHISMEKFV